VRRIQNERGWVGYLVYLVRANIVLLSSIYVAVYMYIGSVTAEPRGQGVIIRDGGQGLKAIFAGCSIDLARE